MQNNVGGTISNGTFTIGTSFVNDGGTISDGNFTLNCDIENKNCTSSVGILGGTFTEGENANVTIKNKNGRIKGGTFTVSKIENHSFDSYTGEVGIHGFIYGGTFNVSGDMTLGGTISGMDDNYIVFNVNGNVENFAYINKKSQFASESSSPVTFTNYGELENVSISVKVVNDSYVKQGGTSSHNYAGNMKSGTFSGEVVNNAGGTISGGTFGASVTNNGTISGGTFSASVTNNGTISGGTFSGAVTNSSGKTISGGTFGASVTNNGTVTSGIFNGEFINNGTTQGISTYIIFQGANVTNNGAILIQGNSFNKSCTVVNYGTLSANPEVAGSSGSFCRFLCAVTIDAKTGITPMVSNCMFNNTVTIKTSKCIGVGNQFVGEVKVDGLDNLGQALNGSMFVTETSAGTNYNRNAYTSTTLFGVNTITHDHFIDLSTGLCECGYECPHVVNESGLCSDCGYQYSAKINIGSVVTYFKSLADALDAAENGDTLYILKDISFSSDLVIDKSITLVGNDYPDFYEIRAQLKPAEEGETAEYATLTFAEGVTVTVQAYSNIAFIANVVINGTFSYERGCMAHTRFNFEEVVSGTRLSTVIGANGKVSLESNSILCNVTNFGTIEGGCFRYGLTNYGVLTGTPYSVANGTLNTTKLSGIIINYGRITGGFLPNDNASNKIINGIDDDNPNDPIIGVIEDGRFAADVENRGIISGGTFTIVAAKFNEWDMMNRIPTVINSGTISGGTFECNVVNNGTISNGTFQVYIGTYAPKDDPTVTSVGTQTKAAIISGGTFDLAITDASYTNISNGTFKKSVKTSNSTISGGTFEGYVENTDYSEITNGIFNGSVKNTMMSSKIKGGTFNLTSLVNEGYGEIQGGTFTISGTFTNDLLGMITGGQFTLNGDFVNNANALQGGTFIEGEGSNVTIYNESAYSQINGGTFTVSKVVNKKYITGGTFYVDELVNGTLNESDGSVSDAGTINGGTFYVSGELKIVGSVSGRNNSGGDITYVVFNMSADAENYTNLKYCKFLKADTAESVTLKNYGKLEDVIVDVNVDNVIKTFTTSAQSKTYSGEIKSGTYSGSVTNANGIAISGGEFSGSVTNNGTISGGTFSSTSTVVNNFDISAGTFNGALVNNANSIMGGTFNLTSLTNTGTISVGTFTISGTLTNSGTVSGGTFSGTVANSGTISGGEFSGAVTNSGEINGTSATFNNTVTNNGNIIDGIFKTLVVNNSDATISGGTFSGTVTNGGTISGGTFSYAVENNGTISGGTFSTTSVVENNGTITGVSVEGTTRRGTFNGAVSNNEYALITDGTFGGVFANFGAIIGGTFAESFTNNGTISGGTFNTTATIGNSGTISGGTFGGSVNNESTISGGTFSGSVNNNVGATISDGGFLGTVINNTTVSGGTFSINSTVTNNGTISGGTFNGTVTNDGTISGGTFNGTVTNNTLINGGKFNGTVNNNDTSSGSENVSAFIKNGEDTTVIFGESSVVINNHGIILSGTFNGVVTNKHLINGGTFTGAVTNDVDGIILGATFTIGNVLTNYGILTSITVQVSYAETSSAYVANYGRISSGTYSIEVRNYKEINGGTFNGAVVNMETVNESSTTYGTIFEGTFNGAVTNGGIIGGDNPEISNERIIFNGTVVNNYVVYGGTFNGTVTNNNLITGGVFSATSTVNNGETTTTDADIQGGNFGGAVVNKGAISGGDFSGTLVNDGTISFGRLNCEVTNNGTIAGGNFVDAVINYGEIDGQSASFIDPVENKNGGTIVAGIFNNSVTNSGIINGSSAIFYDAVTNNGEIINGNFNFSVINNSGATISGGNFNVCETALQNNGTIKGGTFAVAVTNNTNGTISGGTFNSAVLNNGIITSDTITIISIYPKFTAAVTNYGKITSISASDTFSGENCSVINYGSLGQYVDATLSSGLGGGGVTFNCPVTFESSNTVTALAIGCTFNASVSVKVAESIGKGNRFNDTITAVGFDNLGAVLSDSAFIRDLSMSVEFVSPYAVTSLTAVITVEHTHTYVDSTTGLCECGKGCDHESANESAICATCGCQLQAKVQNTAGGSKNYMRLKDAVKALVDNDILTVYCDVTYDADITVNASCTIVLGEYKLIGDDIPSELATINPVYAKLIIASGKTVAINGTSTSQGEINSSITVQNGATLVLNNVKMTPDINSLLRSEDNYVIENYGTIDVAEGQSANSFSLKGKLVNYGTIKGGEYSAVNVDNGSVNYGTIEDAVVLVALTNYGTISGGTFSRNFTNSSIVVEEATKNGTITGGIFNGTVTNNANCVISGGTFNGSVVNNGTISGGTFGDNSAVTNNGTINGGTFSGIVNNNESTSGETTTPAIIDKSESGAKPVFSGTSTVNNNNGTIKNGEFGGKVYNFSLVENGTFNGKFNNSANGTISNGTFNLEEMTENYGTISNGTFSLANNLVNYGTISSGTFALASSANDNVIIENFGVVGGGAYSVRIVNSAHYDAAEAVWTLGEIKGGTFSKLTENCGAIISGGTFNATVSNNCENDSEGGLTKGIIKGGTFKAVSNSAIISKVDSRFQPTFNGKVDNLDTIEGGIFNQTVYNLTNGVISDGQFRFDSEDDDAVVNNGTIKGGVFIGSVMNFGTIENGASRPVFNGLVTNGNIIKDGVFNGEVENMQTSSGYAKIEGGVFNGLVTNNGEIYDGSFGNAVQNKGYIVGGTFGVDSSVNNERKVQFVKNDLIFKGTFNNLPTGSIQDIKDENTFANTVNSSGSIVNCVFYVPVVIKGTSAEVVTSIDQTTFKNIVTIDAVGVIGSGVKFDNAVSIADNSEYATSLKDTVYGSRAFFKLVDGNEVLQNADVKTLSEVFVKRHVHSVSSETGTCSCGYECPHDNHSDSGICDDCSYQLQVKLAGASGVKYVKNLETAVGIYESNDVLTLLCDVTITKDVTFDNFAFIDLNGKSIGGNGRIITSGEDNVVVVFRNSGTTGKVNVTVKVGVQVIVEGGAFANFEATSGRLAVSGGTIDNIKVNSATFEINGGNVGTLGIWSSDANDIYISGGTFTAIELYGNLNYSDVLASDHAYKLASDGSFIKLADMNSVTSVTVSACNDHAWTDGVCDYCGNVCEHIGGTATCTEKATCTNCGHEYGEIDAHNHSALNEVKAVASTVTSTGNIAYYHCTACDKYYTDVLALHEITFAETIVQKLIPSIIEGNDGLFVKNSENGLTFKSDALKEDFIGVFVDGEEVAQDNYTLADDGTEITLGAEYLDNLASGVHTLEIRSIGGGAVSAFTIQDAPSEGLSGGAWAGIGIAIAVAVIGLMFGLMYAFKRRA